jgi:hypothetical protein
MSSFLVIGPFLSSLERINGHLPLRSESLQKQTQMQANSHDTCWFLGERAAFHTEMLFAVRVEDRVWTSLMKQAFMTSGATSPNLPFFRLFAMRLQRGSRMIAHSSPAFAAGANGSRTSRQSASASGAIMEESCTGNGNTASRPSNGRNVARM